MQIIHTAHTRTRTHIHTHRHIHTDTDTDTDTDTHTHTHTHTHTPGDDYNSRPSAKIHTKLEMANQFRECSTI